MVFEVKEFNDVIRFNIRPSEDKMAANMMEICHLNDYNSSDMTARDPILVSTLWFSRSRNSATSSDLTLDYQQTRWTPIWWKFDILMPIILVLLELEACYWCQCYGFDVKECSDIIIFVIGISEDQDGGQCGGNLVFKWLYLEFYV